MVKEQQKQDRSNYLEELYRIQQESKEQTKLKAQETSSIRNRVDKLNREVLDKEQTVMELQNQLILSEADLKHLKEQLDLSQAKMRALEAFSSELQLKYDRLEQRCKQKEE